MTVDLTAGQLDRLAADLRVASGLVFPTPRLAILRRAALDAMRELDIDDPEQLVRLVSSDQSHRARLAGLATVGETYFFRHPDQLDELRRAVIEPLVAARHRDSRPRLRIWSAGCASGEEAYSLAMLVAETIGDIDRWDARIVATDLDAQALARAGNATYGRWSVRAPLGRFERWLTRGEDGALRVAPEIRRLVTFEQHNLAALPVLPRALREGAVDLVACRNVMIYLDQGVLGRVLDGFGTALAEGGWLVCSPVESSMKALRSRFEPRSTPAGPLYRRRRRTRRVQTPRRLVRGKAGAAAPAPRRPAVRLSVGPMQPVVPSPALVVGVPELLEQARALADGDRLAEARQACVALLRRHPTSVEGHLLLASVAEAQDDLDSASTVLRRLLYLERDHPIAQFRLGLLDWRLGRTRRARHRLRRAVDLVADQPDEDRLADGLSPGRLRSVAGGLLE